MDKRYKDAAVDDGLIINLRDLGHTLRFLFEGRGSQKRVLILLYESDGMTQQKLTKLMGIQPGSASEVIGKLESAGLVQRTPNPSDRRTTDVRLTQAGVSQAQEAVQQRKVRHQEMFSCLSPEEKDTLLTLLKKLNTDWNGRYRRGLNLTGLGGRGCSSHGQGCQEG